MASPNTIARNESMKDLRPKMIEAISKKDSKPCAFRNGQYNPSKHTKRAIKGLHRGNTYGKKNYGKQLVEEKK